MRPPRPRILAALVCTLAACGSEEAPPAADAAVEDAGGHPDAGSITPLGCDPRFGDQGFGCGGDLAGSWRFIDLCASGSVFGRVQEQCRTVEIQDEVHSISGTMQVTGTTFVKDQSAHATARATVPSSCALLAGGCDGIERLVERGGEAVRASCFDGPGGQCDCEIEATIRRVSTGTVTVTRGVATQTSSTGDRQRFAFCVDGAKLSYRALDGDDLGIVYLLEK